MSEAVDILLHAKDLVLDNWVGRHPDRNKGEHCASTALCFAAGANTPDSEIDNLHDLLSEAIRTVDPSLKAQFASVPYWNDHQTDKQVVIDAFDAAIRLAKEREL